MHNVDHFRRCARSRQRLLEPSTAARAVNGCYYTSYGIVNSARLYSQFSFTVHMVDAHAMHRKYMESTCLPLLSAGESTQRKVAQGTSEKQAERSTRKLLRVTLQIDPNQEPNIEQAGIRVTLHETVASFSLKKRHARI